MNNISFCIMKKDGKGKLVSEQVTIEDKEESGMVIHVHVEDGRLYEAKEQLSRIVPGANIKIRQDKERIDMDLATASPAVVLYQVRSIPVVSRADWMGN